MGVKRADEVVFFIPTVPQEQLDNIRMLTGHLGYKIVAFAHSVSDLKKELLEKSPMILLLWDDHSLKECKDEFYELIIQFQQQFYMFALGQMHYPSGSVFTVKDHAGAMINEERPPYTYTIS
ncbi:hypothetical protein [Paenibacillus contaminans]|uniref:Uncharacterized protein n=1 Tax=Paenibacillus contaminans TaxID=450362 RepID=A0A329MTD9_9BACL|nr:hypothetical protein [Paenibacillus contaminans]RAV22646.1 hypothetical protein DQG23_00045 [Paenibacillus contaminans]